MDIQSASEINIGLILTNRLSSLAVRPSTLIQPYDKILRAIQKANKVDMTQLALEYGPNIINAALDAVKSLNGLGELTNWPKVLEESSAMYSAGLQLEKLGKKLQAGETIDWSKIAALSRDAQLKLSDDLVKLSDIEAGQMPFVPTGWKVFDEHIGGLPEVGLVVVGGRPGVGKTWLMSNLVTRYVKVHKDRNAAVFSLEMVLSEVAERFKGNGILESDRPTSEEQDRIFMCDKMATGDEIIQKCTTVQNLGLVCVDFADLAIHGEATEGTMSVLYKTLAAGAKELHCTIVLFSQLTRRNGIPKPSDLRFTGLAEALGWMILTLFDPSKDWTTMDEDDEKLPVIDNSAYILVWKVRGGFRRHLDDSPGAICVPFKGKFGWHPTKSKWFTLKKFES